MEAGARILIVDDEKQNRVLLRAMLGGEYRIEEAVSGPQALELLTRERFDLELLDVMMPGMTGYEVCKSIKAGRSDTFLPVLLFAALSAQDQKNLALQAGADAFLPEPEEAHQLILRVRSYLMQ